MAGAGAALRQDDLVSVGLDAAAVSLLEAAD
ncbi:ABC transporter ATP-binding protein [Bordetella pertussis]|nr:ABC transporter ATP-binding protein [Bordetella pertussis]CPK34052.1 ABC transporter ATP-binding protein [Bordetella pertussis]CPP52055.1 ABC transporter ATP-binding protein [Bordetella pertussis]CPQ09175.1 ABC transporter ATP-binding protein [Bordetella pertussis]CPQ49646.1 ABC transporter ATP-binding protein [Bordetella pertussis]